MESFGGVMFALLTWILLILGYAFSLFLLCVPFFRLNRISKGENGADHDHLPVLYIMSLINSMAWLGYGCLDPQSYAVILINLAASAVHISYTVWYICLCDRGSYGMCTSFVLVVVLVFFGVMFCIPAFFPDVFRGGRDSLNTPVMISAILMYIGPIPDMVMAMWYSDPARMFFPIVLASFGNAICWGEYGRSQALLAIQMSNEWGVISPCIQIAAYLWLRRNDIPAIYIEIMEFFQQITETMKNRYTSLRDEQA